MNRHHCTRVPWDFLLSASRTSLQSYELSRLSHAANVRKEIAQLLDVYLEESANAMLARCLMERPKDVGASTIRRATAPVANDEVCAAESPARPAQSATLGKDGGSDMSESGLCNSDIGKRHSDLRENSLCSSEMRRRQSGLPESCLPESGRREAVSDNFLTEPLPEQGMQPPRLRGILRRGACA